MYVKYSQGDGLEEFLGDLSPKDRLCRAKKYKVLGRIYDCQTNRTIGVQVGLREHPRNNAHMMDPVLYETVNKVTLDIGQSQFSKLCPHCLGDSIRITQICIKSL